MNDVYKKRDLKICTIIIAIFIIVMGYQYFLYYLPIWEEKVPSHWGKSPMANGWMLSSDWYLLTLSINLIFLVIPLGIGYFLSKFFAMKTRDIVYSPFTMSFPFALMFFFFFSAINESVYASYLKKGILSQSTVGIFYAIIASIMFAINILSFCMAFASDDDSK